MRPSLRSVRRAHRPSSLEHTTCHVCRDDVIRFCDRQRDRALSAARAINRASGGAVGSADQRRDSSVRQNADVAVAMALPLPEKLFVRPGLALKSQAICQNMSQRVRRLIGPRGTPQRVRRLIDPSRLLVILRCPPTQTPLDSSVGRRSPCPALYRNARNRSYSGEDKGLSSRLGWKTTTHAAPPTVPRQTSQACLVATGRE
jgi:hypothetical protein